MSGSRLPESSFLFAVTRPGAEPFLKQELSISRPDLRFAYSRPGFVTFKASDRVVGSTPLSAVFARAHGASLGPESEALSIARLADALGADGRRPHLFVIDRDPGEDADPRTPRAAEIEERLRSAASFAGADTPQNGDVVIDVIVHGDDAPWVGYHVHGAESAPLPGGRYDVRLPPEAPSRAWAKIEELIAWSGVVPRRGETALELGSAPGGASYALLRRGLDVVGVDPGAMDPRVLAFDGAAGPRFRHLRAPAGALKRHDLPRPLHWLAMDMNLAARVALRYAERAIGPSRSTLLGAFLTLKLGSLAEARELPTLLERIRSFGFVELEAAQLWSHRQEVGVVALTERGLARRARRRPSR